jgi:hypothetical protein
MANLTGNITEEGAYAIQHRSRPVQDVIFSNTEDHMQNNLFEKAFPCLFPYGCDGIENWHSQGVDFIDHIWWALRYHDCRFCTHETCPFFTFSILQHQQASANPEYYVQGCTLLYSEWKMSQHYGKVCPCAAELQSRHSATGCAAD